METRHLDQFGIQECKSCYEISIFKWRGGFICKRPGCGSTESREGATPFSKQCKKCGRDESVTAHTVFDKLRISRTTALALVKTVIRYKRRLKIEELTKLLNDAGYTDVNPRSIWTLLNKIYERMTSPQFIYDEAAVIIMILKKKKLFLLSKGTVNGEFKYNAKVLQSDRYIHDFIKSHTGDRCKVAFYVGNNINSMKATVKKGIVIQYREILALNDQEVMSIATRFYPWADYLQPYLFKRNGGTYDQLMEHLTNLKD